MERFADIKRKTKETDIAVKLNLDGTGITKLEYPIGFFKHMLDSFAHHGLFDIEMTAAGDLEVDQHHLIEDTGILLGRAFSQALGNKEGIKRTGSCLYPMDETLARAAVDLSGRPFFVCEYGTGGSPENNSSFQADTIIDFWQAFSANAVCTIHLDILRGRSGHHKIEAMFKAAARALRDAVEIDIRAPERIPSTKGILDKGGLYIC
jgi:imidazoleglycerol-phosphate dehydratase